MTIPISNLYYLFCYAWHRFPEGYAAEVGQVEGPQLPNLFARLLVTSANRLMRRGLDRGYHTLVEDTRSPRGRLDLNEIAKRQTLRRGSVVCAYDELTVDVLHNRIIKATAMALARADGVTRDNAHDLQLVAKRMAGVSDLRLRADHFSRVQLSRNTAQYASTLRLCETVFRSLLPVEGSQGWRFADILKDEARMSAVFEEFLRNFYQLEQTQFPNVAAETMRWDGESFDAHGWAYLPTMLTDITLRSPSRVMVIDAKYYASAFSESFGAPRIHSGNLYQLMTYMRHAGLKNPAAPVDGALIYPASHPPVRLRYHLGGHHVQVVTIDFTQPWQQIHRDLLGVLDIGDGPKAGQVAA